MTSHAAPTVRRIGRRSSRRTLLALALAGALVACGGGDEDVAAPAEEEAEPTELTCPIEAAEVPAPEGATTDLSVKPEVQPGEGPAPTELQYADIVEGDGEVAETGDQVLVKYVGAFYETGEEFDSSWSRGEDETLPFGICRQGVIPGFAAGPTGMKVGGRRRIVIPSHLAYGPEGSPPAIPPDSDLVFVVDLVDVV